MLQIASGVHKLAALSVIFLLASANDRTYAQRATGTTVPAKDAARANVPQQPHESAESYAKIRVEVELRGTLHYAAAGSTVTAIWRNYELYHEDKVLPGSAPEPWKLDFSRAKQLQATAKALDGQEVVVTGLSELRMVARLLPPGGTGGGFGGRDWPPAPTWSVWHTVVVSGIRLPEQK